MEKISLTVNGRRRLITSPGDTPLLYVLRDELGLGGPKFGCGLGQCSACMVLIDGKAKHACRTALSTVGNARVTTIEGLGTPDHPHPLQTAFIAEQAAQCGYCTAGMIVSAAALLAEKPHPTDAEIHATLDGNLCRCGCQPRVVRAVRRAAEARPA